MAIQTEKPIECVGCNTFDMKSLFDNSDCSLPIEQFYATRQDAEGALEYFTLKARDVESEPCQIQRNHCYLNSKLALPHVVFETME